MEDLTPAVIQEDAAPAEVTEQNAAPEENAPEEAAPEPVAPDTVMVWLARVKPSAVLAVLRDPDFAPASVRAFLGFRVNAQGFNSPLVRQRLASEAARDSKLAERLQALAEAEPSVSAPPVPLPAEAPAPVKPDGAREAALRAREQEFRARRDHLRQERDEARFAQKTAEDALGRADDARRRAEDAQGDAVRVAETAAARVNRLERQIVRLKAEADGLRRAVRQSPQAETAADNAPAPPETSVPPPLSFNPWADAVQRLLDRGRPEAALALLDDVLRADDTDARALLLSADAHARRGDPRAAAALLRRLLTLHLARGQMPDAADALGRLLTLAPARDAERDVRAFLSALRPADHDGVEAARALLARLSATLPRAHELVQEQMAAAPLALFQALLPAPGTDGPEMPLPLPMDTPPSAPQIVLAIDTGDELLVTKVRDALRGLTERDARAAVLARITEAVGGDFSYGTVLTARPRGPVVVDGSNVAWYGQELLAAPRARLRSLLEMRRALRDKAYFPIFVYADANLPYAIDDPEALRGLLARGEIRRVDAGTQADIVVLREAKRLGTAVVTNDYMTDYDPNGEVPKIRFDLPPMGGAYLLT